MVYSQIVWCLLINKSTVYTAKDSRINVIHYIHNSSNKSFIMLGKEKILSHGGAALNEALT